MERAEYCNNVNADFTVRIHADGNNDNNISGIHILYPSGKHTKSINNTSKKAAELMLEELINATGAKKAWSDGLSPRSDLTGFNWAKKPVALPELGFMSNANEDKKLATSSYQDKLVTGLANGIDKYFGVDYNYFSPTKNIPLYKHMTGSATIGTLYKSEEFPIITDEFVNWYKVKFGNTFRYIKKANTKGVSTIKNSHLSTNRVPSKTFTAKTDLFVKENITGKQKTIGTINKNFIFPTLKELDNWFQIEFSGRIVYVWKKIQQCSTKDAFYLVLNSYNHEIKI
ncbi:N-acetylmuramoyl-L-alanine amidase [Metabacillus sediminilitoris]|uniref:N-acetylmuramoyl-L-alanine amidase n=1 Tax=Metabacillus sediminilitoris TaxID=2567941 RepID=UPI0029E7D751|nr:N-acetylmuramoyl-L-alanine amidase [Metabacillus sediminilitoris]